MSFHRTEEKVLWGKKKEKTSVKCWFLKKTNREQYLVNDLSSLQGLISLVQSLSCVRLFATP